MWQALFYDDDSLFPQECGATFRSLNRAIPRQCSKTTSGALMRLSAAAAACAEGGSGVTKFRRKSQRNLCAFHQAGQVRAARVVWIESARNTFCSFQLVDDFGRKAHVSATLQEDFAADGIAHVYHACAKEATGSDVMTTEKTLETELEANLGRFAACLAKVKKNY